MVFQRLEGLQLTDLEVMTNVKICSYSPKPIPVLVHNKLYQEKVTQEYCAKNLMMTEMGIVVTHAMCMTPESYAHKDIISAPIYSVCCENSLT